MVKEFIIDVDKMLNTTAYMKRAFIIAKWMKKRYKIPYKYVTLTYYFTKEQQENTKDKVTIKFEFHEQEQLD